MSTTKFTAILFNNHCTCGSFREASVTITTSVTTYMKDNVVCVYLRYTTYGVKTSWQSSPSSAAQLGQHEADDWITSQSSGSGSHCSSTDRM